ncbi:MAG: hypothetical protein K2K86_07620 [Muribaculaceae bacterium]|nr:hypothetical protein [Muribaculaceae bacterium]
MATNRKDHLRYRYGICLNDSCSKCKSKEVQQIAARKDFVCEECQKPLRECPPPKSFMDKYGKLLIGVIALIVIGGVIAFVMQKNSDNSEPKGNKPGETEQVTPTGPDTEETKEPVDTTTVEQIDTVAKEPVTEKPVIKEPQPEPQPKSSIKVPFGTYSGPASGLDGEIKVTSNYTLDLRNAAHESIDLRPGDVITQTKFKNGELVGGYWHRGSEGRSFHR